MRDAVIDNISVSLVIMATKRMRLDSKKHVQKVQDKILRVPGKGAMNADNVNMHLREGLIVVTGFVWPMFREGLIVTIVLGRSQKS
jgi:hypothetical protein